MDLAALISSLAERPCTYNACPWVSAQRCSVVWKIVARRSIAMVWQAAQTCLQQGFWNTSGAWHVYSGIHSETLNDYASWCWNRFVCLSKSWNKQSGRALLWFSGICKRDRGATQEEDLRAGCDASDCQTISGVSKWAIGEADGQGWDWAYSANSLSTFLYNVVYQRPHKRTRRRYLGDGNVEKTKGERRTFLP